MRVLVACEFSGTVRRAFRAMGHEAYSCDLLPSDDNSPYHIQGDVLEVLNQGWDMLIGFPPCTYLCVSGLHWNNRGRGWEETARALNFVRALLNAPVRHIAIENPVGCISTQIRKPSQIIQPYMFGHDASKKTCLWLKNLPCLQGSDYYPPRMVNGKPRWSNQTDSGQNKIAPSVDRWAERSLTYEGIAKAMSEQWSNLGEARQRRLFEEAS